MEKSAMKKPGMKKLGMDKLRSARRNAVSIASEDLVKTSQLHSDNPLPLVVQPNVSDLEPISWARENLEFIEEKLLRHGGILFRDFNLETVEKFEQFVTVVTPDLVNYIEGSSPRIMVGEKVYTSTEYPADQLVSMHSELSYAHRWPTKIFFYCVTEPAKGGETPIADNRRVLQELDSDLVERFANKKVRYMRNLHGGRGAGLAWQTVFETSDRETVEAYCREGNIDFEWNENGGLKTSQVRPSVIEHPKTGERIWFNQVDQWHPSNLGEEMAKNLVKTTREEDLPIHACHGDGSPLDVGDLDEVREIYRRVWVRFPWHQGDALILDNMLTAHGRMPFEGPRKVVVTMGAPIGLSEVRTE